MPSKPININKEYRPYVNSNLTVSYDRLFGGLVMLMGLNVAGTGVVVFSGMHATYFGSTVQTTVLSLFFYIGTLFIEIATIGGVWKFLHDVATRLEYPFFAALFIAISTVFFTVLLMPFSAPGWGLLALANFAAVRGIAKTGFAVSAGLTLAVTAFHLIAFALIF